MLLRNLGTKRKSLSFLQLIYSIALDSLKIETIAPQIEEPQTD
jgi:hypothetical protein